MRAVIEVGGKQYFVKEGDTIKTQIRQTSPSVIEIRDVLLLEENGKVTIGKPTIAGALVRAAVLERTRGKKIRVLRYHSKTRYRRRIGFRPIITTLKIEKIIAP
jgi:large subunit ribosomal protein L21